ncbi:MAG: alpha-ketoacid dehydrogenase subunit beta [Desulfovibrionaceae bacterium]|nr:alpha-ketoacid dehydrogenase subunit beta [Desulfovibrionaceae bacterium]MBF0514101.1 alpha-ketoacid dehydrogenase subunit beta [Desulfovibrionaceae bacterium]
MPWTKVFLAKEDLACFGPGEGLRGLTFVQALLEAQTQILENDPSAFVIGEGVNDSGGVFGSTLGLADRFGPKRVMDMPIAENGLTGIAAGAAAAGMRPIFVHMRMDFLPMCMDQIVNHAAKWHYMSGGALTVPLVIRSIIGRGWGSAAQHSQGLHSLFLSVPGLKIIAPSTPYDAKGLLMEAAADNNPVLVVEHRWLYGSVGYVPEAPYREPFGKALVRRPGRDCTVVAISQMVYEAMRAAADLEAQGVSVEVVDPRSLKPLDTETILASVRRTGRLVVADVACPMGGAASEIMAAVLETDPGLLAAPAVRVSFPEAPTPCSPVLEEAYYPGARHIAGAVKKTLGLSDHG